jgi:hypothetical protein
MNETSLTSNATTISAPPALNPQQVRQLQSIELGRGLLACQFDPTGQYIVASGMSAQVSQLQVNWQAPANPLHVEGHKSWVGALVFTPDGSRLCSADYTGLVHCWAFPFPDATLQPAWSQPAHQGWVRSMAISPDGKLLATCGNDTFVRLWSVSDGAPIAELKGHDCDVYSVTFHPDGSTLVSGDLKGIVRQWDLVSHESIRELNAKQMFVQQDNIRLGGVRGLKFNATGTVLACTGMSGFGSIGDGIGAATVLLFDWVQGRHTHTLYPKESTRSFCNGAAFFPDDVLMAATGGLDRGFLMFWKPGPALPPPEVPTDQPAGTTPPPAEPQRVETFFRFAMAESGWAMHMHPDGLHFAVAHHDQQLRFFDFG